MVVVACMPLFVGWMLSLCLSKPVHAAFPELSHASLDEEIGAQGM